MKAYIDATPESGKKFYQNFHQKGKVVMLNLLRFRDKADYSDIDHLNPGSEISGQKAYEIYIQLTMPFLEKAGSKVLFYGYSNHFLIGPQNERWDRVLLVEHESTARFLEFARNEEYLKIAGHRKAALEDSRLLPISEI